MLKISRLADYAVIILAAFKNTPDTESKYLSAGVLARLTHLPEPTVAKILKMLARGGIISSVRGAGGGYALVRKLESLSLADVLEAVEGPLALTACVEGGTESCDFVSVCGVRGRWDDVNEAVRKALENVSILDMVAPRECGGNKQKLKETA